MPTARPSAGGRSWRSCRTAREVEAKEIVVNDPLVHNGLRFYQASFGTTGKLDGLKARISRTAESATCKPRVARSR